MQLNSARATGRRAPGAYMPVPAMIVFALVAVASPAASAPAHLSEMPTGVWRNPKNTVHVQLGPCGPRLCGTVVWASDKAKADAAEGGTKRLVGTQLFRDFEAVGPGRWRGRFFVPDKNKTFSGRMQAVDANTIIGKGCLIGGLFCKSQWWKRVR